MTQSGSVLGTPAYMAPEQVLGQPLDARTDLYALGVVLYEMLTGKLPFRANSQFELMRSHLETQPKSLKEMTETVPRPLQDTIVRALAKDSDERFQTAGEFSSALQVALAEVETGDTSARTITDGARSPVAVKSAGAAATVVNSDTAESSATEDETRIRTSLEIPLPEPKTALRYGAAAAVFFVGLGWWLTAGSDEPGVVPAPAASPQPGLQNPTMGQPAQTQLIAPANSAQVQPESAGSFGQPLGGASVGAPAVADLASPVTEPMSTAPQPASTPVPRPANARQATQAAPPPAQTTRPAPVRTVRSAPTKPPAPPPITRYQVKALKVSVHERQRTGRLSRAAGYNGSFALSSPPGGQPLSIDELVEVYRNGTLVNRQLIHSETRKPGRFKSKQRIPGLKELQAGEYQVRLVFESGNRRLGQHQWNLQVAN